MDWWWYPLIVVAVFALTAIARLFLARNSVPVEMPGGETIFPPPEPAPPRKRWRITIERR
jgi:hypothetical protein